MTTDNQAFFYVNGDTLAGTWVDLDTLTDEADVFEALAKAGHIGRDSDGEPLPYGGDLLVADAEGLAAAFLGSHGVFDLASFIDCRDHDGDEDAKAAYVHLMNEWNGPAFEEAYHGKFESWEAMAVELLEETGQLSEIPENLRYYFDYDAYARDIRLGGDMHEHDGHFFWNR